MSLLRSRPLLLVASGATFLWFACCGAGNKFHNGSRQLYWRMPAQRQISKEEEEEEEIGWVGVFQEPGAVRRQLGRYFAHGIRRGTALHCARYAEWERERAVSKDCLGLDLPGLLSILWVTRATCPWAVPVAMSLNLCRHCLCRRRLATRDSPRDTHVSIGEICCVFTVSLGPR